MKQIMDERAIKRCLHRISKDIINRNSKCEDLVLIGIKTKGVNIAERLADYISSYIGRNIPWCGFDVTYYRDDVDTRNLRPSSLVVSVVNKTVVLIDDVISSGRTIRAAIDGIMANGRPKEIQLVVLIDKGLRKLPIQPDYVGRNIPTSKGDRIIIKLAYYDNSEGVYLIKKD